LTKSEQGHQLHLNAKNELRAGTCKSARGLPQGSFVTSNRLMEVNDDPGLLKNLIHEFSSQSQNIATIQSLILTHQHFVSSEVFLNAILLEYASLGICNIHSLTF
jgi:hypothetical protein